MVEEDDGDEDLKGEGLGMFVVNFAGSAKCLTELLGDSEELFVSRLLVSWNSSTGD